MMDSDKESLNEKKTVCIIGSGLSGLTCGMKLAKPASASRSSRNLLPPAVFSHIPGSEENT